MSIRARIRVAAFVVVAFVLGGCRGEASDDDARPASSAAVAPPLETGWQHPRDTLLPVGELAPDFAALAHTGHQVKLSTFLYRPSVVYFYPGAGAASSSTEAEAIRDAWLALRDRVGMVLGVSVDDNVAHRAFASERDLPFLLVSDVDRAIIRSFGVPLEDGRATRVTFVIGTDRKVLRVLRDVRPADHGKALVAALEALSR